MNISYSCEESVRENRWAQRSQGSKEQLKNSLHCNTFFHKVRVNKTSDQCPAWKQELPSVSWTYKKRTKQNGKRSFAHNFPAPDSCLSSTPIHKHDSLLFSKTFYCLCIKRGLFGALSIQHVFLQYCCVQWALLIWMDTHCIVHWFNLLLWKPKQVTAYLAMCLFLCVKDKVSGCHL